MKVRKKPCELKPFFHSNIFRLKYDDYIVAEGDDPDLVVLLSSSSDYEPVLTVEQGNRILACFVIEEDQLEKTAENVYKSFLHDNKEKQTEPPSQPAEEKDPETERSEEDLAYEREDELQMAFKDFMSVVLECDDVFYGADMEAEVDNLLDLVLQKIADEGYSSIRRPMYIQNEDGTETLLEYPYECIDKD